MMPIVSCAWVLTEKYFCKLFLCDQNGPELTWLNLLGLAWLKVFV